MSDVLALPSGLPSLHRRIIGGRVVLDTTAPIQSDGSTETYEAGYYERMIAAIDPSKVDPSLPILRLTVGEDTRRLAGTIVGALGQPVIVFYGSDESGIPLECDHPDVVAVCQTYAGKAVLSRGHIALPPGAMDGRFLDARPSAERDIDILFLGVFNDRRTRILAALGRRSDPRTLTYRIATTRGRSARLARRLIQRTGAVPRLRAGRANHVEVTFRWAGGLPAAEYRALLERTRVALCPPGWTLSETFRHFEAASAGCQIVTAPLPLSWVYRDHPFFVAETPRDWPAAVDSALAASAEASDAASSRTRRFWEPRLSPEAAGARLSLERQRAIERREGYLREGEPST